MLSGVFKVILSKAQCSVLKWNDLPLGRKWAVFHSLSKRCYSLQEAT